MKQSERQVGMKAQQKGQGVQKWPTLFKKTALGADRQWSVAVEGTTIITRWGQVGGTIGEARDVVQAGKNIGRANATTPEQQARAEAQSQWEQNLKKGFVESLASARQGKEHRVIAGGIFPMLARRYDQHGAKIKWPAYAQMKLDGHRCIAVIKDGKCALWSRTRKPITSVPHIVAAVEALGLKNAILDGELYNHDYRAKFEQLTSLIRPDQAKDGHGVVQYHIYDLAGPGPFAERTKVIARALKGRKGPLVCVETREVRNEDELMLAFEAFCKQGYEGAIVRNADGPYINRRSFDLQKVKEFQDAEFKVVGVVEGRGLLAGHGIFVCVTKNGTQFEAKMVGPLKELKKFYERPKLAVGKMLTVQFQGYTNKAGVPRFPVALRFRQDI